jgi:hypothetical protein
VTTFGITIENALYERIDVGAGDKKKSVAKYTLPQLLDERFQFGDESGAGRSELSRLKGTENAFYDEVS